MIQLEEERQRPYFVDNDFYNNKYVMVGKLRYSCIKERKVSEWERYSEKRKQQNNFVMIIYRYNYIVIVID